MLTVAELREILEGLADDMPVVLAVDVLAERTSDEVVMGGLADHAIDTESEDGSPTLLLFGNASEIEDPEDCDCADGDDDDGVHLDVEKDGDSLIEVSDELAVVGGGGLFAKQRASTEKSN